MAFDISNVAGVAVEETSEMNLLHPVTGIEMYDPDLGEDEGKVVFTLVGPSNPKHRKAVEVLNKAKAKRGKREPTLAEAREESLNFLVALSVSVTNMEYKGQKIDSQEVFKELYSDEKLSWVRDQVSEFLSNSTNFINA